MKNSTKDTLIALLKYPSDLTIASQHQWYRIPVRSAPQMVREKKIRYLAFYQPKHFKEEAFKIRWYGEVHDILVMKRKELFPEQKSHPRADEDYYRLELSALNERTQPIFCRRPRRVLFIATTLEKFQKAIEINDVFYESPLEEAFWEGLKAENIIAERQYGIELEMERKKTQEFYLDFAVFSRDRNIDIECDGNTYHTDQKDVNRDKKRSNLLERHGWAVLRYPTEEIRKNLQHCIQQVKETVNRYGGLQSAMDSTDYRYLDEGRSQLSLFDE